jgi:hypothetical protein
MTAKSRVQRKEQKALETREFTHQNRPIAARIDSVNVDRDQMRISGNSVNTEAGILHPFYSRNAWFRAYPEAGSVVTAHAQAEDPGQYAILSYYRNSSTEGRRLQTDANIPADTYRKMYQGELEVSSIGKAQTYWSRNGDLEHRAGLITQRLSHDGLEIKAYAPTHIRQILGYSAKTPAVQYIADEERFGATKRSIGNPYLSKYIGPTSGNVVPAFPSSGVGIDYHKEYVRVMYVRPTIGTPSALPLIDYREGSVVVNDLGLPDTQPIVAVPGVIGTSLVPPYRFRGKYFTIGLPTAPGAPSPPSNMLDFVMSSATGSVGVSLPATGGLSVSAPLGIGMQAVGPIQMQSGAGVSITTALGLSVTTPGATSITSSLTKIGSAASVPLPALRVGDPIQVILTVAHLAAMGFAPATPGGAPFVVVTGFATKGSTSVLLG